MISDETIIALENERLRQHKKFNHEPLATDVEAGLILGEEFGEVCRAICQGRNHDARQEAVELAAVCIAWLDNDLHYGKAK